MSLKRIIKFVFPIIWLKKVFIFYNRLKINTVDKVLFPEYRFDESDFVVKRDVAVYDALGINEAVFSPELRKKLQIWHNWKQDEYLLIMDQVCLIEPDRGWALSQNKLIYYSLGFGNAVYVRKPHVLKLFLLRKSKQFFNEVISLRDTGEENYFHFYNDILSKFCFLEERLQISRDIPIVISMKLYNKPYFQFFLKNSSLLNQRNWVIQGENDFVIAQKAYFCKPLTHQKKYLDSIVNSLALKVDRLATPAKVFLYRNPKRLRFISNFNEVSEMCKAHGFEIIDTDELTLADQISWFSRASHIIGIHGAGMVNMIYGKNSIKKVLEIFPPGEYAPFHYIMLAKMYGFEYDALIGLKGSENLKGGFTIDTRELEQKLASQ